MQFSSIDAFAASKARTALPDGPVALVLCDTAHQLRPGLSFLGSQGVGSIILLGGDTPHGDLRADVPVISIGTSPPAAPHDLINRLIDLLAGHWLLWLWSGEYFFFPFGATRSLRDLLGFLEDERRPSLFAYTVDLYAESLPGRDEEPGPGSHELYFDRYGYHGFQNEAKRLKLYGGLGWRFEELIGADMQQIGRTSLFKASADRHLNRDLAFDDPDYAAVSCPWHHNPTGAVMSFRRVRRLFAHPQYPSVGDRLMWPGSERFEWSDRQLLDLGIIEPGQWF